MSYTFAILQTQVRLKVGDVAADVTQPIDDAIAFLSNFFCLEKNATVATVANQIYLANPAQLQKLDRLVINSVEYKKLSSLSDLGDAEISKAYYFYQYNGQIQILPTPTSIMSGKVWGRFSFASLAGAGSSDVPDTLIPLVVLLATWFYFLRILADVAVARSMYPGLDPDQICKAVSEIKKQFDSMLDTLKKYVI